MSRLLDALGRVLLPSSGDVQLVTPGSTGGCSCCAPPFNGSASSCLVCIAASNGSSHAISTTATVTGSVTIYANLIGTGSNTSSATLSYNGPFHYELPDRGIGPAVPTNDGNQCVWTDTLGAGDIYFGYTNTATGVSTVSTNPAAQPPGTVAQYGTLSISFTYHSATNTLTPILAFSGNFSFPYQVAAGSSANNGLFFGFNWVGSDISLPAYCHSVTVGPFTWTPTVT